MSASVENDVSLSEVVENIGGVLLEEPDGWYPCWIFSSASQEPPPIPDFEQAEGLEVREGAIGSSDLN